MLTDTLMDEQSEIEPRSNEDLAHMLRMLIANFCNQHFAKYLRKPSSDDKVAPSNEAKKPEEDLKEESNKANKYEEIIETLSPPGSSSSNKDDVSANTTTTNPPTDKPSDNQVELSPGTPPLSTHSKESKETELESPGFLEIFGSVHVRLNSAKILSCLIDEQLGLAEGELGLSSSASSVSSCSSKLVLKSNSRLYEQQANRNRRKKYRHRHCHYHHYGRRRFVKTIEINENCVNDGKTQNVEDCDDDEFETNEYYGNEFEPEIEDELEKNSKSTAVKTTDSTNLDKNQGEFTFFCKTYFEKVHF